jgi:hypothetical protein
MPNYANEREKFQPDHRLLLVNGLRVNGAKVAELRKSPKFDRSVVTAGSDNLTVG